MTKKCGEGLTHLINDGEFASELLEGLEKMFSRYYMHSDIFSMFKYSTTP